MGLIIEEDAGVLSKAIAVASLWKRKALINPLVITMNDGKAVSRMTTDDQLTVAQVHFDALKFNGSGRVILDPDLFISRLQLFEADETVKWSMNKDGKHVLEGKTRRVTITPQAQETVQTELEKPIPLDEDGRLQISEGTDRTFVTTKKAMLEQFVDIMDKIDKPVDYYVLRFSQEQSIGIVGDYDSPDMTPVTDEIPSEVVGPNIEVILAVGYPEAISNMGDDVELTLEAPDVPVQMFSEVEGVGRVDYILGPRRPEEAEA